MSEDVKKNQDQLTFDNITVEQLEKKQNDYIHYFKYVLEKHKRTTESLLYQQRSVAEELKEVVSLYEKKADFVLNLKDPDLTPDMVSDDFLARLKFNFEQQTKQAQKEFDIIDKKQKEYEQQVKTLLEFEDKIKAYNGANALSSFVNLKNETEKVLDNTKTNQFKR